MPTSPSAYQFKAPGGTCVLAMCSGRHRVEDRVGVVRTSLVDVTSLSPIAVGACFLFAGCLYVSIAESILYREVDYRLYLTPIHSQRMYNLRRERFKCLSMARVGACVGRESVFSTAVLIVVQAIVARDAPRAATKVLQYIITLVQANPGRLEKIILP